jgi:phosphohistidine phosphatase
MKTMVIARHAKSDWGKGLRDHDRPLNRRGKNDAPRMGRAIRQLGFLPDLIITSSAVRAKTTADMVAKEAGYQQSLKVDPRLYEAGYEEITLMLQALPDKFGKVMVFGHNPIIEQMASYLLQMAGGIVIPTSGMVCMEARIQSWSDLKPGHCSLKWLLIPRLIS